MYTKFKKDEAREHKEANKAYEKDYLEKYMTELINKTLATISLLHRK